jgi:hypothetical protein
MKTFEKPDLDCFLELPLVARNFLEIDKKYSCIHDDNEGYSDQCLTIILKKLNSKDQIFQIKTPVSPGLRFRNYAGGGSNLPLHNSLKVLIYAFLKNNDLILPGMERESPKRNQIKKIIREIHEGSVVLPAEVFADKRNSPHYFFDLAPCLQLAISVDGDTHIIANPNTEVEKLTQGETTRWNPDPFVFHLNYSCSRAVYNALILVTLAIESDER